MLKLIEELRLEVRDLSLTGNILSSVESADKIRTRDIRFLSDRLQENVEKLNRLYSTLEEQDGFEADLIKKLGIEIHDLKITRDFLLSVSDDDTVKPEELRFPSTNLQKNVENLTKLYEALEVEALPEAINAKLDEISRLQTKLELLSVKSQLKSVRKMEPLDD